MSSAFYQHLLFQTLATLQKRYGDEPVRTAVQLYHQTVRSRWERIREIAAEHTPEALYDLWFHPEEEFEYELINRTKNAIEVHVTRCHLAEELRGLGERDLGFRFYCLAGDACVETFNPEIRLERPETIVEGGKRCIFRLRAKVGWCLVPGPKVARWIDCRSARSS